MGKARKIKERTDTLYEPVQNEAIVLLMVGTGIRVREICNLRVENLPFYHKQDEIEIVDGKGRKDRIVAISDWLKNYLDEYCRKYHSKSSIRRHLFNSRISKPITRRVIWGRIKTIGRDCGIWLYKDKKGRIKSRLSPHKFRHTYATLLLDVTDNEFLVQDQLGHKSLDTTHIYAKTLEMKRKTALNELQKRIFEGVNEDFSGNY
jgi:integrase/recombinase XerD